jgi:hypothetical protein
MNIESFSYPGRKIDPEPELLERIVAHGAGLAVHIVRPGLEEMLCNTQFRGATNTKLFRK